MSVQPSGSGRRRTGPSAPAGGRAAWGTLSRSQVIDAAAKLVADKGYEQLTIRSLASALGVAPMSLYRHVRDKNDVLDEVVDRLLAKAWRPKKAAADWRPWIADAADILRRFLVEQPAALAVFLSHPVVSPAAVARMEAVMEVLRRAVGDEDEAARAYAAIQTYTIGFAALEASRAGWEPETDEVSPLAHQLAAFTTPQQFADGLNYILRGIGSSRPVSRRSSSPRSLRSARRTQPPRSV